MSPAALTTAAERSRLWWQMQWFFAVRPHWWVPALSVVAWVGMLMHTIGPRRLDMPDMDSLPASLTAWLMMVFAMMLPLVTPQVYRTALDSFWGRRYRAMAGFLAGYLLPWCALGLAAFLLLRMPWMHAAVVPS